MYMFNWLFGGKPIQEVLMRDPNATETIIWQHPSTEFNTNSRVNLGLNEVAVFYDMYHGNIEVLDKSQDLKTNNIPILSNIPIAVSGGVSKYQCRVYFIRTSASENLRWGTTRPLGPFHDGSHKGMVYSFTMNGLYSFQVVDVKKILQFVDSDKAIDFASFEEDRIVDILVAKINKLINQVVQAIGLDFMLTREFILNCDKALAADLQETVLDDMGLKLKHFEICDVSLPDDPNDPYKKALASMTEESAMVQGLGIQGIQNYMITHGIKIGEMAASGNGIAGDIAGIGVGAGVGVGIGGQLGNMMQNVFGGLSSTPTITPTPPVGGDISNNLGGSSIPTSSVGSTQSASIDSDRLLKLKELYKLGIITKEQYDIKVAEILNSI